MQRHGGRSQAPVQRDHFGGDLEAIHNNFMENPFARIDQMQSNLMKNFGMDDPFKNDPFFNQGPS